MMLIEQLVSMGGSAFQRCRRESIEMEVTCKIVGGSDVLELEIRR